MGEIKDNEKAWGSGTAADSVLEDAAWQPIETAPKDGEAVILTEGGKVFHGGFITIDFKEIRDSEGNFIDQIDPDEYWMNFDEGDVCTPTHWMPKRSLPMPPDAAQPAHPDDAAVDALAAHMKAKLAKQRAKGYGGWDDPGCSQQRLSDMLRDHVAKGDPVDVANFCAFLVARGEGIAQSAPAGVLEDAARWHWMAEYIVGTRTDLDDELIASATVDELRKLVDADLAARKQGEKQ